MTKTHAPDPGASGDETIGAAVHTALWRAGWQQQRLAQSLGMSQSALSRKLVGSRPFYARELVEIAAMLDVAVDVLVGLDHGGPTDGPTSNDTTIPVYNLAGAREARRARSVAAPGPYRSPGVAG